MTGPKQRIAVLQTALLRKSRDLVSGVRAFAADQSLPWIVQPICVDHPEAVLADVDGAIFDFRTGVTVIHNQKIPMVSFTDMNDPTIARMAPAFAVMADLAADTLISRGMRTLVLYSGMNVPADGTQAAIDQFLHRARQAGLECLWFGPGGTPTPPDVATLVGILHRLPRPVGVFAPAYNTGDWLTRQCHQYGIFTGTDFQILGVGERVSDPSLAGAFDRVIIPRRAQGYQAARILHRLLAGEAQPSSAPFTMGPPVLILSSHAQALVTKDPFLSRLPRDHEALASTGINDLASGLGLSISRFNRLFQQRMGITARDWLWRRRLSAAAELLITSDLPIAAIATRLGYASPTCLNRIFQRGLGLSPSRYREQTREIGPLAARIPTTKDERSRSAMAGSSRSKV